MKKYFFNVSLLFLALNIQVLGQKVLSFEEYKSRYPDKQAIMLLKKELVKISLGKNDSIDITLNYYSEMLHLSDRTEGYAENSIPFSDFVEIKDIDAKTLVPAKSTYKQLKVTEFSTKNLNSSGIFFDDNKVKVFNYPGVLPGAKTILSYTQKFKESKLLSPYYFNFYVPVLESEITIMVDKRLKIGYRLFNNADSKVKFSESSEGDFTIYKWTSKDLPEYVIEKDAPRINYHEPHLIYFLEEMNVNRKEILLKDTEDLYRWYYSLAIENQKPIGEELQGIVDSLTSGGISPLEKTKNVFYWVQDHVKYVAFEDGYGGFIPRDANLVCDRRFGDCKDMANILVTMLTAAGVPAHHVWIGTRDIPYSYSELPTPNVDNHMIAAVKSYGKYLFLDATGRFGTLEMPTSMIQGKEALIGLTGYKFEIEKVPVMDASKSKIKDTTFCRIDNTLLKGNGHITLTGYNKIDYTYALNYSKKEDLKDVLKGICTKGSNKFSLLNYEIKNLNDRENPLLISYEFELEDYVKSSGKEVYINLNLDKSFNNDRIDTLKRKLPIERDNKYIQEDIIVFEVPNNYAISYLPPAVKDKTDFFEMEISYILDESKIIYHKKIVMNTLRLEKREFKEWNDIINKLSQAYREVVVIKQK